MEALRKILYVEDDEDMAELTKLVLETKGGFEAEHCTGGRWALDAIESSDAQLIIMDMMMPGMDGMQTLEQLRQLPKGKDMPVIFMTAKA